MENTVGSKGWLLIFLIFFVFCVNSDANQAIQNGSSSQLLLRKLGMKVSDLEYYKREAFDVNPSRKVPGGPSSEGNHFVKSPSIHYNLS
ncbi:hypothetical protein R6Q59_002482 [Mikania micrantha]